MLIKTLNVTPTRYWIQFFYNGMKECNTLTDPALAEESTSAKGMTSRKYSKLVREGFSSKSGQLFLSLR